MKAEKLLARKAARNALRIGTCLRVHHAVKWFRPSTEDVIRLLKLQQWETLLSMPIETQLGILIPVWQKKFTRFQRHQGGMGVTVATLVGKKSEEILKDWIFSHPYNGFQQAQRNDDQRSQLFWMQLQETKLEEEELEEADVWAKPGLAMRNYKENMKKKRKQAEQWQQTLAEKPYRGNPFLS